MQIKYNGIAADEAVISMLEVGIKTFSTNYKNSYTSMYGTVISKVRKVISEADIVRRGNIISVKRYIIPLDTWNAVTKRHTLNEFLRVWLTRLIDKSLATCVVVEELRRTLKELSEQEDT